MSKPVGKSLGEMIKDDLKEKGLNQSAIARKMNVSKQVINQIDRRKDFDLDFLLLLREATGLDYTQHIQNRIYNSPSAVSVINEPKVDLLDQVEMSLSIKIKSTPDHLNKVGELLLAFRREALKMGFTIQ